jgi:hypothetical protein
MTTAGFVDWAVFWTVVAIALVADIVVARLRGRTPTVRNAALWSGVWIGLGLLFGVFAAARLGGDAGISYLTAYLLEKSLSVDNLFLFVLIFAQTGIPTPLQHRALFWGILSALIMRAILNAIHPMVAAHPGLSGIYPLPDARDAFAARQLLARPPSAPLISAITSGATMFPVPCCSTLYAPRQIAASACGYWPAVAKPVD